MSLQEMAKKSKNILKPYGHTDVLLYYGIVAQKLKKYLKGKELAAKILLPSGNMPFFIRRGSKDEPLFIEEFCKGVTEHLLEVRNQTEKLKDAEPKLNKSEAKAWHYFVPRKLIAFFYATNNEGAGKNIERIFFDIDRSDVPAESAQKVAKALIETIEKDSEFNKLFKFKTFVMWTGNSFHVYLLLTKPIKNSDYEKYLAHKKDKPLESFTGRWAEKIKKELKIKVSGGHEKIKGFITIDPSQTPSGKLCRAPFCLHMKDAKTVDGVAVPLTKKMLDDTSLVKKLQAYTPEKIVKELNDLSKRLP
ncbi:hypothetical protein KY308_00470 [Candidatus Woesearchaeota archaeon]|nr:hypothetical protein [Candidatus Woesearchaeota archaeon]